MSEISSNNSSLSDSSKPFFISPSDNLSSVLVSTIFTGVGFNSWKRSMMISLSAKNKIGFVDGSLDPPAITSPNYSHWYRANSMVISWILNSLSKSIADSVLFLPTAHAIWTELIQRYEQSNGAMLYHLQQQLFSFSQGSDFSTYFTKLTKLWDELRIVQDIPSCSCGTVASINKFLKEQRLIQLLMGLNDSYKLIRGQILMMKPLPAVSTAYSIILQEEHQRDIHVSSSIHPDAIAMAASSDQSSNKKLLVCNHCKKGGHIKSQCYRLHGFPPNFKFTNTKPKRDDHKSVVQNVTTATSPNITVDQYNHLLQMFQSHSPSSSQSHANVSITEDAMNDDGTFFNFRKFAANVYRSAPLLHVYYSRIVDSGATDHMCSNRSFFLTLHKFHQSHLIGLPDEHATAIEYYGPFIQT